MALYGAYAADVNLDSSALKDAAADCSTTWDGSEFQSPTVRTAKEWLMVYPKEVVEYGGFTDCLWPKHLLQYRCIRRVVATTFMRVGRDDKTI